MNIKGVFTLSKCLHLEIVGLRVSNVFSEVVKNVQRALMAISGVVGFVKLN